MKDLARQTDIDVLGEIIKLCEDSMVGRVAKKKAPVVTEPELETEEPSLLSEEADETEESDSLSDQDMAELIEDYQRKKKA
jgi:hypothetical protein